jgi:hypothetical protein
MVLVAAVAAVLLTGAISHAPRHVAGAARA